MARTRPQDQRSRVEETTEPQLDPAEAATAEPLDPRTEVDLPDPTGMHEGDAAPSSGAERPEAGDGAVADAAPGVEGPSSGYSIHDPGGRVGDGHGTEAPGMGGLEDLLTGGAGYGGADGRNPANDGGGGHAPGEVPDFGAGSPINPGGGWRDLDGANGRLSEWQQDYLGKLRDQAVDAAARGDEEAANEAARMTQEFLAEIGAGPPDDGGGSEGDSPYEMVTNFGSGNHGATKQVWNSETGEVEEVATETETNDAQYGSEATQMGQTGTDSGGNQEGGPPPDPGGVAQDLTPDSAGGPDVWEDFTDGYHDQQTDGLLGGDVDPNPNDDPTSASMDMDAGNADPYVAEYEAGYTPATQAQLEDAASRIDATPDEEFMET